MSRRVKRSTDATKPKTGYSTQREGEYSSRRSARGGDNFLKLSSKNPYCVSYFKNNPGSMDMRTPSEKLQELNDRLDAEMRGDVNLVPSEKFKTLTQIKSITFMINGENSSEMVKAYANLGYFYNDNNRPQSAVRNLEKAHNLERTNPVDKEVSINIAVETAKAQLSIKSNHGNVSSKQAALADEALSPYYETEIEKVQLRHKRDLIKARIFAAQKKFDESIKSYELSIKSLKEMNDNNETEAEANIFLEMAQVAERKHKKLLSSHSKTQTQQTQNENQEQTQNQTQQSNESSEEIPSLSREAGLFYKRAYDIYTKLGMEEEAKNIEPLLLSDEYSEYYYEEEEEEEEEEATDTHLTQEDENNKFAPREPTDESGSRNSSRRRQFREKASENSQDGNLEKQQNGLVNGLLNNNEEEQAAEEANIENNEEEENNENNVNNEEENNEEENNENNEEENNENNVNNEEEENKEEEEKDDDAVLEKQNNDLVSGLVGSDEEKKTDENA